MWEGSEGKAVLAAETRVESGNVSTFFGPQHFFLRVGVGFFFIFVRIERKKKYIYEGGREQETQREEQRDAEKYTNNKDTHLVKKGTERFVVRWLHGIAAKTRGSIVNTSSNTFLENGLLLG